MPQINVDDRSRRWLIPGAVGFIYLALSVALTWPLALHLRTELFGDFGDTRQGIYWLWAKIHGYLDGAVNQLLAAPFGTSINHAITQPVSEALLESMARFAGEVGAFNSYIILAFPLTAFSTFLVARAFGANNRGAFVAGLIFGFCPAAVYQSLGGHAAFAFNPLIPPLVLTLYRAFTYDDRRAAVWAGILGALILLSNWYFGYFAALIALYAIFFGIAINGCRSFASIFRRALVAAGIALIIVLPFEYRAVVEQLQLNSVSLASAGRVRELGELYAYSSRPLDFLIPPLDHPIFGRLFAGLIEEHVRSSLFEQTLYLGLIPCILFAFCINSLRKTDSSEAIRRDSAFLVGGAAWMCFVSLPPTISFFGAELPTPSYFLYPLFPMFRAYARCAIPAMFFVGCAAGVSVALLRSRFTERGYAAIAVVCTVGLLFEYWSIAPDSATPVVAPAVYQWLARQRGDFIVAEYPMIESDEAAYYTYEYWQRVHVKRLVNGAKPTDPEAWRTFKGIRDISDPVVVATLRSLGTKFIVVHGDMYKEGPIPTALKRFYPRQRSELTYNGGRFPRVASQLRPLARFGEDVVFGFEDR